MVDIVWRHATEGEGGWPSTKTRDDLIEQYIAMVGAVTVFAAAPEVPPQPASVAQAQPSVQLQARGEPDAEMYDDARLARQLMDTYNAAGDKVFWMASKRLTALAQPEPGPSLNTPWDVQAEAIANNHSSRLGKLELQTLKAKIVGALAEAHRLGSGCGDPAYKSPEQRLDEDMSLFNNARADAFEEAAKVVEDFPYQMLHMWERPGGPPGNGYRDTRHEDIAAAVRALAVSSTDREGT